MNGIIRQIIRVFLWRGIYLGIRRVADWWGRRQSRGQSRDEAKATQAQTRKSGQNANRLVRLMRRFSRF